MNKYMPIVKILLKTPVSLFFLQMLSVSNNGKTIQIKPVFNVDEFKQQAKTLKEALVGINWDIVESLDCSNYYKTTFKCIGQKVLKRLMNFEAFCICTILNENAIRQLPVLVNIKCSPPMCAGMHILDKVTAFNRSKLECYMWLKFGIKTVYKNICVDKRLINHICDYYLYGYLYSNEEEEKEKKPVIKKLKL